MHAVALPRLARASAMRPASNCAESRESTVLTLDEMYRRDQREGEARRRRVHSPCEGRRGKERQRIDIEELRRLASHLELPEAKAAPGIATRFAPCIRPRRPDLSVEAMKRLSAMQIPPSVVMRGELTMETLYPWCTIGKLFAGRDEDYANPMWVGSGALVGPNLMITASHAVPWDYDSWWVRFVPAYRNGSGPFGEAYVEEFRGVRNKDDVTGLDYVICKLYERIGDQAGWMGSWGSSDDDFYYDSQWTSVGYPTDSMGGQVPMAELDIGVEDVDDEGSAGKEIETHVFSTGGWSGGPLWGWVDDQARVVGVMSGNEEEFSFWDFFTADHSVSAGGVHLVDLVKYGWATWV